MIENVETKYEAQISALERSHRYEFDRLSRGMEHELKSGRGKKYQHLEGKLEQENIQFESKTASLIQSKSKELEELRQKSFFNSDLYAQPWLKSPVQYIVHLGRLHKDESTWLNAIFSVVLGVSLGVLLEVSIYFLFKNLGETVLKSYFIKMHLEDIKQDTEFSDKLSQHHRDEDMKDVVRKYMDKMKKKDDEI